MILGLLIISLLLHGVTALWIFTLMKRLELVTISKKEMEQAKNEIEDLLLSYTEEMKEENERLVAMLKGSQQKPTMDKETYQNEQIKKVKKEPEERYDNYAPPTIDQKPIYERSTTAEVLALAKQGQTTEQIAKSLDIGTGEVELMLKFYDKSSR